MTIATYQELKSAIQSWCKRSDAASEIDNFIYLAELDIWQRLRIRDMEDEATISTSTTSRTVSLPSDFLGARGLKIDMSNGADDVDLRYEAPNSLRVIKCAGLPTSFTITNEIELNRVSDQVYSLKLTYFKPLTALSSSNTTNAVLTRFPMIYLFRSMFYYALWAEDDELLAKYTALFDAAISNANSTDRKGRYGPAPGIRLRMSTP